MLAGLGRADTCQNALLRSTHTLLPDMLAIMIVDEPSSEAWPIPQGPVRSMALNSLVHATHDTRKLKGVVVKDHNTIMCGFVEASIVRLKYIHPKSNSKQRKTTKTHEIHRNNCCFKQVLDPIWSIRNM